MGGSGLLPAYGSVENVISTKYKDEVYSPHKDRHDLPIFL